ncbi:PEP-CTERM sorting domain-containing protein [Oceaniferula spumae]
MKTLSLLSISLFAAGSASAATVVWDFNTFNGVSAVGPTTGSITAAPDFNDFGSGVTITGFTLAANAGQNAFRANEAQTGVREPNPSASITVTIDNTVSVDLSTLAFTYGFDNNTGNNALTPQYSLSFSQGSGTNASGSLPTSTSASYIESTAVTSTLSGLTGLTNTAVTFTWTFDSAEDRNNDLDRRHFMDDITLTGTVTAIPEPSSSALLGLGMTALLLRRRR